MLALQYGLRGAIGGTALAFGLFAIWNLETDAGIGFVGTLVRIVSLGGTAALVAAIDATQARSSARLSETDTLLRGIAANMPDALYVIDEDERFHLVNEAAAEFMGKTPEEIVGERFIEHLPISSSSDVESLGVEAGEDHGAGRIDRVRLPGGHRVFRSVIGRIGVGGKPGFFGISHDITAEYRREVYARVQQRIAERLVTGPAITELPGIVLEELVGLREIGWGAYWHRDEDGVFRCLTVAGTDPAVGVGDRREGLGMPGPFRLSWREARGDRGGPTAMVPVGPDGVAMVAYCEPVEDPEEIERIFKPTILLLDGYVERTRLAREAERTKNEFFGLISHELRTPLTSIIGYSELLAESDELSPQAQRFVEVIDRNARRELRLVQDLLLLVRLEGGSFVLERDTADLTALVAESCEILRPQADAAGVTLEPSLEETGPVWIDPHRIGQVVDNLLTNAIKFSESGGVVRVRLTVAGERATLEVEDEGMGVPADELERLFERMYRSRTAVLNQIQGTGLGLTIVKSVVEAHGGRVSVHSREGEGTTFSVELPLERPPAKGGLKATERETA